MVGDKISWGGAFAPLRKDREPDNDADDATIPLGLTGAALREYLAHKEKQESQSEKVKQFASHLVILDLSWKTVIGIVEATVVFDSTPDKKYTYEIDESDLKDDIKDDIKRLERETAKPDWEQPTEVAKRIKLAVAAEILRQVKS